VLRRPDRFVLAGAGLVLAQLAFRGWALAGSWFYFDDLAFMSRAANQPLDVAYLTESYGGHLMPAGFALTRLLNDAAPFDWLPWAATLLALQALAGFGMLRLLLSMFGRRWLVIALLAGYLSYVFTLSAGIWWAAGINQLPLQVALVFGLHAFLAHLRTGRIGSLVAALLWTAAGLAFYEKTLLLVGVYAIIGLCWFASGTTPERLREFWDRYRVAVVAFTVLGGTYLGLYVAYGLDFSPAESSGQSWGPLAWNLVMVAFATAVLGGPLTWRTIDVGSLADPSTLVQLGAWVVVGGLVYYAFRTRTHSRRAWLPLVFTMASNVVLLASARAAVVGPDIAREYRYQTESGALVVITAGLAFLPLLGAREVNTERPEVPRPYERLSYGAAAVLVVVALAAYSSVQYVDRWQDGNPSEPYFTHVQAALADADEPVPLVDAGLPQTLLWSYRFPENIYSHVFRDLPGTGRATYPDTALDNLYLFDDAGRLAPVVIPPIRSMVPTAGCGYSLPAHRPATIPLNGPVIGGGWWIQLGYASPVPVTLAVEAGDRSYVVDLPRGLHNLYFQAEGEFSEVRLSDAGGDPGTRASGLCVATLDLGVPAPVSTPS
jgi:hypothetical protein